ncbi:CLUMA_CG005167, isoform A [Clunio marinus]|uniref:CLUMA_CG005167, isoform A n=1 Tax=Clunio marinus TaxID=568069 RepID=A0A1J1HZE9_9DIPT|nr:CLUMA_CG005167, isoform A [Clunio marinus]
MSFCSFLKDDDEDFRDDFIIDDSFSSDYNEEFRTNSSSSSIKWSINARKQNEEDWLEIEKILYGEEKLPEDEKTREEFESWRKAFPHLRIVGKKIDLPAKNIRNPFDYVDEIIAIDPPVHKYHSEPFRMLDHELNEKLSIRKARQPSGMNQSRTEDLEKLLRITSSGLTRTQQQQYERPQYSKKVVDRTSTFFIKQNSLGKKLSKIQEHKQFEMSPSVVQYSKRELDNKLSYSASSSSRMVPKVNVKFLCKKPDVIDDVKSVKSASKLPLYADVTNYQPYKQPKHEMSSKSASIHHHKMNQNTIQLPPFNYDLDFPIIQGRGYNNQKSSKFTKH